MTKKNKKIFAVSAGILLGVIAVVSLRVCQHAPGASPSATDTDILNAAYPLYGTGISWGAEVPVTLPPHSDYNPATTTFIGYQVSSLPTPTTNDIAAVTEPLRDYYDKMLLAAGWNIDTNFEADGPGGSIWGYTKGKDVLIFSYNSLFLNQQPNQPEQCPCTVNFIILGGELK